MYTFFIFLFVLACALMVVSILLQSSKGHGLAGAFGGMGGAGSAFGPRGAASFLQRVTIILAILYGLLCIFINLTGSSSAVSQESVLQKELDQVERTLPEAPLPLPGEGQQQESQE
jgi:preprotein translocase subunit SecG